MLLRHFAIVIPISLCVALLQDAAAGCPYTYTSFPAGSTIVGSQVIQNFQDLSNCFVPDTGGTISGTLTVNGALLATGHSTLSSSPGATTSIGSISTTSVPTLSLYGQQANPISGAFANSADAIIGGYGGNYLAIGQAANFSMWLQAGYSSASSPVYYSIDLNPLGGNVGIGTTGPTSALHVLGTSTTGPASGAGNLTIQGGGGNGLLMGTLSASPYTSWIQSGYIPNLGASRYNLSLNPLGGNVGIGTTSPNHLLDVEATDTSGSQLIVSNSNAGTGRAGITIAHTAAGGGFDIQQLSSGLVAFQNYGTNNSISFVGSNVAIGTTSPSYLLHVNGTMYASGYAGGTSDRRHKKDIQPYVDDALGIVQQLKPTTFQWRDPTDDGMRGTQIGFIAQDVAPVLPEIVLTANNTEKTLGLKYDEFIPVLTRALQQQQEEIKALEQANNELKQRISRVEASTAARVLRQRVSR